MILLRYYCDSIAISDLVVLPVIINFLCFDGHTFAPLPVTLYDLKDGEKINNW